MRKATANSAIDFNKLFALKDQLAHKGDDDMPADDRVDKGRGSMTSDSSNPPQPQPLHAPTIAPVIALVPETLVAAADKAPDLAAVTQPGPPPALQPSGGANHDAISVPVGPLRIGMPRHVHERVRASAALACLPTTTLVRDVLESTAPNFDITAPLSELTRIARSAVPEVGSGRRPIEVRMQVPMSEDLHRRLVQLAALRAQTLSVCLLDLLEHGLRR
jgi:hypothetical protein